ncbi:MAG TPA: 2'-5' RNA ligase family protein [Pedococcus sp.]|nr:2'-5' RNA ligase family protein [Pedococcus sp.]
MALAVCLLFDREADRAVRQLWTRLEAHGIPTLLTHTHGVHVPHVSYAVYRTFDVDAVLGAVSSLPSACPTTLRFDAVGLFRRRRGALIAASTVDLLRRQEAVVAAGQSAGADLHRYYLAGQWVPHCSLSTGVRRRDMPVMTTAAFDILPLEVNVASAALVDSSTGRRWPLPHLV